MASFLSGPGIASLVLVALCAPFLSAGCATERPFVWIHDLPPDTNQREGVIHARDTIMVVVKDQPTFSAEFLVREDGGCLLSTLGDIHVEGRTVEEVTAELRSRLKELFVNPTVAVSISRAAPIRVSVVGEVRTPGTYELTRNRSVTAALAAAGWLGDFAAKDRIFLVRQGPQEIRIRFKVADLTHPETNPARFHVRDGDVVVVE